MWTQTAHIKGSYQSSKPGSFIQLWGSCVLTESSGHSKSAIQQGKDFTRKTTSCEEKPRAEPTEPNKMSPATTHVVFTR